MSNISKGSLMSAVAGGSLLSNAIQGAASAVVQFSKDSLAAFGKQEQF